MINFIPAMLRKSKLDELNAPELACFYKEAESGFFRLMPDISVKERAELKGMFKKLGFSALNFTDSRAVFQFYNLDALWEHIKFALDNNIKTLHLAVEPLCTRDIYQAVTGDDFINEITKTPPDYSYFRSLYANKCGGYFFDKAQVLAQIKKFTANHLN